LRHVEIISQTTVEQMRRLISQGEIEGLSTDQVARNIVKQIPTISRYRANAIARTETHTAANYGSQAAAEATGLNIQKEWVAANDERTREDHIDADGQIVGLNESFDVGGEALMFPGDPSGSAGNIINCRCTVAYITE
jgi:SPP1 gp7 family putative phage head morphogenesis protein